MNEQKKSDNRYYIYVAICIAIVFAAISLRSCRNENSSGADRAADDTRGRIEQSVESNRELQSQIGGAAATADGIAGSISRSEAAVSEAAGTAASIEDDLDIAVDAIGKCQSIITDIKRRSEGGATEP